MKTNLEQLNKIVESKQVMMITEMFKKWFFGFKSFPRKENSPEAAKKKYALTNVERY